MSFMVLGYGVGVMAYTAFGRNDADSTLENMAFELNIGFLAYKNTDLEQ